MRYFGEKGIIKKAQEAKDMYEQSVKQEENAMNGLLQEFENALAEPPEEWDLDKVAPVTSEDGVFVPVPKGYTASTIDGEKSVETGFVIKEGTNGGATEGINEFVWVPVPEISDLYDSANNAGQLWDFGTWNNGIFTPKYLAEKMPYPTTQNDDYREPDVITDAAIGEDSASGSSYDATSSNLEQAGLPARSTASDFKAQLQREFNTMKDSVEKYGGFYIGRYETGDLSKEKAVVQKNNSDIADQTWYTMYKLSKTVGANENVISSMIWGCQWDATLRWMQGSKIEKVKNFPTNSALYGNYRDNAIEYVENGETKTKPAGTDAKIPTGSSEQTKINNIYDMAGNVEDWTSESYERWYRSPRGGTYAGISATVTPACNRSSHCSTIANLPYVGSRLALYVAPSPETSK